MLSRYCIVDIETIPDPDAVPLLRVLERKTSPPKSYSKPDSIAAWHAEQEQEHALVLAEQRASLSLDPLGCRIVAATWVTEVGNGPCWVGDEDSLADVTEKTALNMFWDAALVNPDDTYGATMRPLIGFGIIGFDLPVLIARSLLLGVCVPGVFTDPDARPWDVPVIDLAAHPFVAGYRKILAEKRPIPRDLKTVCRRLGIPVSDDISGADIARLYAEGRYDLIAQHVTSDVRLTRALAERLGVIAPAKVTS